MSRIRREKIKKGKLQTFVVRFYWFVIILFFLAAVCVEYFIIIKPKLEQTFNGGPLDIGSRQVILEEQRTYYEALKVLEKEAGEINQAELEKVNYVIAKKIDIPDILKQIYLLSKKENMEFISFNYVFDKGILQIDLSFKGTKYQDIKKYLGELEKNIRIMDVTNISLGGIGSDFSLKIQSYYLE
ncbi:hypothetical protein KKG58_01975 [Patescibacteria group bacterium]|nr:hypothetical protein [Patescibacteria group bacterium]